MVGAADRSPRRVCPITGVRLNQYQEASRPKAHAVKRTSDFQPLSRMARCSADQRCPLESKFSLINFCRFRTVVI